MRKTIIDVGWKKIFKSSLGRTRAIRVADGVKRFMMVAILSCVATTGWTEESQADPQIDFNIPQQRADLALTEFAEQADLTLAVPRDVLLGKKANALIGSYTLQEGVDVLLAGTGLIPEFSNRIVLSIKTDPKSVGEGKTMKSPKKTTGLSALLASVFVGGVSAEGLGTTNEDGEEFPEELEEIIVTGTNIRGVGASASPVLRFDRKAIDESGAATAAEFIQRAIPQNFAAGASEDTFTTTRDNAALNVNAGTGVNLRGLGTDSTLILINGKRVASDGFGSFVDVSQLPLSAIDRVEILTDGASAIYGSDAVGGVVNFILKDDHEGAETRLRFGSVTDGSLSEYQAGQAFGTNWDSGRLLFSYEFYNRTALDTEDREATKDVFDPFDVLPEQTRHSLFLSGAQDLTSNIELYGTVLFTNRDSERFASPFFLNETQISSGSVDQLSASLGSHIDLGGDWLADLSGTFSQSNSDAATTTPNNPIFDTSAVIEFESWIADAILDGPIAALPGGQARLAFGGHFRSEDFKSGATSDSLTGADRDVYAVFGELFIPIVGSDNNRLGLERLEITAAGRFEDYSDFGSSTDPKVGLLWSPIDGLNLRGTWGTSFRAPLFTELDDSNFGINLTTVADPNSGSGSTLAALLTGGSPALIPEDAETWTVGFEVASPEIPGFQFELTYFNIDFTNRIVQPTFFQQITALSDPTLSSLANTNFSSAELTALVDRAVANGFFFNFGGSDPADTGAIIDGRSQNLSSTEVSGFDINTSYRFSTDIGELGVSFNGTYLTEYDEQFSADTPVSDAVGIVFRPPEIRFRAGASWNRNGFGANVFVNYVDNLSDNRTDPAIPIDSYTTVDFQINAELGELTSNDFLGGTSAYISVINAFDEQPPLVPDNFVGLNFDADNHDILGRFIAVGIAHQW